MSPLVNAQANEITVRGSATCESDSISYITIKAQFKSAGYIAAYLKADKIGLFRFSVPFTKPDTLTIVFTRTGYGTQLHKIFIAKPSLYELNVVLSPKASELDSVQVKAPPTWKRGDTTFYRVDAYTRGYEQKLIDAVRNIPELEITPDGDLLFRHKLVEKIMVEGQELFADQVKMLLANVPLHIVKNLQLLENQRDDSLMNDLGGGGKVFMNLELRDGVKWQFMFGDARAGLGTLQRYLLNPVLFSIRGKVKTGLISNLNNTGDVPGYGELAQLQGHAHNLIEAWVIRANRIQGLPLFNSTTYLQNQLFKNQLQVNYQLGKRVKAESSLSVYTDRQQQNIIATAELLQVDSFFKRTENRMMRFQPSLWQARQKMEISTKANSRLAIDVTATGDFTTSASLSEYIYSGKQEQSSEKLEQHFLSLAMQTRYTRRINHNQAVEWKQKLSYQHLPQQLSGTSPNWNEIFNVDSPRYQQLRLNYTNRIGSLESELTWTGKKKNGISKQSLLVLGEWNNVSVDQWFNQFIDSSNAGKLRLRNQQAHYTKASIVYATQASKPLGKLYKIDWHAHAGLGGAGLWENVRQYSQLAPQADAEAELKNRRSLGRFPEISFSLSHNYDHMYRYPRIAIPQQLNNYRANLSSPKPITKMESWFNVGNKLFFKRLNWFMLSHYTYQLQSYASLNRFQQFLQVTTDTLLSKPSQSLYNIIRLQYIFDPFKPSDEASLELGYNFYQYWLNTGDGFSAVWIKTITPKAIFNHPFTKWLWVEANGQLQGSYYGNNDAIKTQKTWRYDWYGFLQTQIGVGKKSNLVFKFEYGMNDWNGPTENRLVFGNIQYSYKFSKKRMALQLNLHNIFDQKSYSTLVNTTSSRYYTQIPLVGRNVFISCRYDL